MTQLSGPSFGSTPSSNNSSRENSAPESLRGEVKAAKIARLKIIRSTEWKTLFVDGSQQRITEIVGGANVGTNSRTWKNDEIARKFVTVVP
jgi:hypothetical protein